MFTRTNPDPYRNSQTSTSQYIINGYTDLDRRWSDRGSLFVSDLGDTWPGTTILKSTPTLGAYSPGPDSIMDGQWSTGDNRCCGSKIFEEEEDEEEVNCIEETQDFLDSLPSPDEYMEWLLDRDGPCSELLMLLCNYYPVSVWHCPSVKCVWQNGWCYNCTPGDTGDICLCNSAWWCEKIVFANHAAAQAFLDGTPQCIKDGCAVVGEPCVVHTAGSGNNNDEFCQDNGCQLFEDRTTPVAYTAGAVGDSSCGQDDNDGDGEPDRQPAPEDNAWGEYIC